MSPSPEFGSLRISIIQCRLAINGELLLRCTSLFNFVLTFTHYQLLQFFTNLNSLHHRSCYSYSTKISHFLTYNSILSMFNDDGYDSERVSFVFTADGGRDLFAYVSMNLKPTFCRRLILGVCVLNYSINPFFCHY